MGGGTRLSYAAESTSEISAEPSSVSSESENFFVRSFHSIWNLISSFFSWSIERFGDLLGGLLGLLGVGTPLLFVLWVIKTIIGFFINRYIISPAKKVINKHSMNRYGTNVFKNDIVEYKRPLSKRDIIRITKKYGASEKSNETHNGQEVYTEWQYGVMTWYFVYFCDDGIHAQKGVFSPTTDFMSYDKLRDDDTTVDTLEFWFEDYPADFYHMLTALKEA